MSTIYGVSIVVSEWLIRFTLENGAPFLILLYTEARLLQKFFNDRSIVAVSEIYTVCIKKKASL